MNVTPLLTWIVTRLARFVVARYRPGIIGVTGSVGKTSTKLAIGAVLSGGRNIRVAKGNLNSELGLSLAVLGDWQDKDLWLVSHDCPPKTNQIKKITFWLRVLWGGVRLLVGPRLREYPEILVLEYGVDRPGDMKQLLKIARPNVSVITAIGEVPAHVEFFGGADDVAREKARLIECLPAAGFAILNLDDETVIGLQGRTRAHRMNFGFSRNAEMRISRFENRADQNHPLGISFALTYAGSMVPVRLEGVFGRAQAYSAAAAACVGLIFGLNLLRISENLRHYKSTSGRGELTPAAKGAFVLDDSYNASPLSMHAALDTLRDLPGKRKIAVLGDMLEIGQFAMEAHQYLGEAVKDVANIIITVGPRAKFIAEGAKSKGMKKGSIMSFDTAEDAAKPLHDLLKKGDLVLIKGSHAIGLSRLVDEIRAF